MISISTVKTTFVCTIHGLCVVLNITSLLLNITKLGYCVGSKRSPLEPKKNITKLRLVKTRHPTILGILEL